MALVSLHPNEPLRFLCQRYLSRKSSGCADWVRTGLSTGVCTKIRFGNNGSMKPLQFTHPRFTESHLMCSPMGISSPSVAQTLAVRFGMYRHFASESDKKKPAETELAGAMQSVKSHDVHDHHETHGLYHHDLHHSHGTGREHLFEDGTRKHSHTSDSFHWDDPFTNIPRQKFVNVDGVKMIQGIETRPMEELFTVSQSNLPFWPRARHNIWGNTELILKAEFLFFYGPAFIILSLMVPSFAMIYLQNETVYTTMTVKVIGRQWYWVYEVESPLDDDEEE